MMIQTTGTYDSPKASQYLQQLCKHFAHKTEVSFDAHQGRIALRFGAADLAATDTRLTVTLSVMEPMPVTEARHVIDKHLAIFAHREGFESLHWQDAVLA